MTVCRVINCMLRRSYYLSKHINGSSFCVPNYINTCQSRLFSQKHLTKSVQNDSDSQVSTDYKEIVKENTKSAWYLGVIVAGVGVTCLMFYAVFSELFSSNSPNGVYSKALKRLEQEYDVVEALGKPIKAHGEETRRGRRGHVAHTLFLDEMGKKHMRMQFYVKGSRQTGTVYLEVKEDESGDYKYRYLFIQLNDYKRSNFLIEDNRLEEVEKKSESQVF